jgi:hypothetical protein
MRSTIPAFTAGTTDPVSATFDKLNPLKSASVLVEVCDVLGNCRRCDPVIVTLVVEKAKVKKTFIEIPAEEHFISVQNGAPGLKKLVAVVNGQKFKLNGLEDNQVATLDVSSAMNAESNTITLKGRGAGGSSAVVTIADVPIDAPTFTGMLQSGNAGNLLWGNLK